MGNVRILAFAGSARTASFNKMLINVAARAAGAAGADVTLIDLREFPMPIYDGDDEAQGGLPAKARELRALFKSHAGFMIATPEYNGSVSALLKNALDWCSRPADGEDGLLPFRGKTALLMAASVSPFGGVRAVGHLRAIMSKMGANVLADEVLVPGAATAFDAAGELRNEVAARLTAQLAANLATAIASTIASAAGKAGSNS